MYVSPLCEVSFAGSLLRNSLPTAAGGALRGVRRVRVLRPISFAAKIFGHFLYLSTCPTTVLRRSYGTGTGTRSHSGNDV